MKIITTTYEDFVNNEIAENGHDFVEAQFLMGFQPTIVNGIWIWLHTKEHSNVLPQPNPTSSSSCNVPSNPLRHSSTNLVVSNY